MTLLMVYCICGLVLAFILSAYETEWWTAVLSGIIWPPIILLGVCIFLGNGLIGLHKYLSNEF